MINGVWALRNLSYLSTVEIKQDIVNGLKSCLRRLSIVFIVLGLTIERIYEFLEKSTDEQMLKCLLSLIRCLFDDNDIEIFLPMLNSSKLISV